MLFDSSLCIFAALKLATMYGRNSSSANWLTKHEGNEQLKTSERSDRLLSQEVRLQANTAP